MSSGSCRVPTAGIKRFSLPRKTGWKCSASASEPFRISASELRMEEYRGSYVSLCALREEYPGIRFRLLVGADSYVNIPHWRDPKHFFGTEYNGEQLLCEFELIVFNRHGFPMPSAEEHLAKGFAPILTVG